MHRVLPLLSLLLFACAPSRSAGPADANSTPDPAAGEGIVPEVPVGPGPAVSGIETPEVVPGGPLVLTGQGFGTDPTLAAVRLSAGAWSATVVPGTVTDTRVTATVPSRYDAPAAGEWCDWAKRLEGSARVVAGGAESNGVGFVLSGIRACQPAIDSVTPAEPAPGDTLTVKARGLSPEAAADLVELNGEVLPVAGVQTTGKADATTPFDGSLQFVLPADAESGPLRVRRTDGIDGWSEPYALTVQGSTGFPLSPGIEAAGVYLPYLVYDIGLPTQRVHGDGTVWVLDVQDLPDLYSAGQPGVAVEITTARGSFEVKGTQDAEHVYVQLPAGGVWGDLWMPEGATEALAGIGPGDSLGLRVRGYDPVSGRTLESVKVTLAVRERFVVGRAACLVVVANDGTLNLHCERAEAVPVQGELLRIVCNQESGARVLTAPGLWDGSLTFSATGMESRTFPVPAPGTYTITDMTTGASLTLEIEGEGVSGTTGYPSHSSPPDRSPGLVAEGASLLCGGARVDIPPGALPEVEGGYTVLCNRYRSDFVPLASQITDGGYVTQIGFDPEPPRLLKPITLSLPYGEKGRTTAPELGLADPGQGVFFRYPTVVDQAAGRASVTFPAGEYPEAPTTGPAPAPGAALRGPATLAAPSPAASATPEFPKCSIGQATRRVSPYSWSVDKGNLMDEDRKIELDFARDETGVKGVSQAYAESVMIDLVRAYDFLKSQGWPAPDGWVSDWIVVTLASYGPCNGRQGATTKGVFGQPWVYLNSTCPGGNFLSTSIAHEMGHVFQRQLTTNVFRQWMDEASAQWAACGTLGTNACDIEGDVRGGWDFPERTLPNSVELNGSGYGDSEAYAAGALAIFLEQQWSGSLLKYYQELSGNPAYWAYDHAYPLYEAATGETVGEIVSKFAPAYWSQAFPPLDRFDRFGNEAEYKDWPGVSLPGARPKYSSTGWIVRPDQAFGASLKGQQVVLRTKGLAKGQRVEVFGDKGTSGGGKGVVDWIVTAYDDAPDQFVATFEPPLLRFRVVIVNATDQDALLTVRLVAPHVSSVSSSSGKNVAGASLTVSGVGFGDNPGTVTMNGFEVPVTSWTDGSIQATTVLLPGSPDQADVRVETAEHALSAPGTLVFGG